MAKWISSLGAVFICVLAILGCSGNSQYSTSVEADFAAYGIKGTINGQNVLLDLSGLGNCVTTIENMVLEVSAKGASISPDPRIARDYSQPVQFNLTAPDGTNVTYSVKVIGAKCMQTQGSNTNPTPVLTTNCSAPAYPSTGYSLVFKGCDANNQVLYYAKDECVRDNTTGLIWQGQTGPNTGSRANNLYKTNFDSTTSLQMTDASSNYITPSQSDIDVDTNSLGFRNNINAAQLCGFGNWRLPTKDELLGLVKPSEFPTIDATWFVNATSGVYWTSTSYDGFPHLSWTVSFYDGVASDQGRGDNAGNGSGLVRLVRFSP
ncbi:MAG TPA: DUF1566 domain-containing protein [Burkholderiaceae bacterium]|nr:DUF1566 domain-containing protein [Burkholderiaceae bacterium]